MTHYDVIIIGAGVAGLSAATALSKRGLRVAIIDKGTPDVLKTGECLMADALPILTRLGFLDAFLVAKHESLQAYQIHWGQDEPYERHLMSSSTGTGWILNRQCFDDMLIKQCEQERVDIYWEYSLQDVEKKETWNILTKGNKELNLTASFIIDASGRARAFTRKIGVTKHQTDKLLATCCHIESQQSSGIATIVSDDDGWWYHAKYSNTHASLAYFTDADLPQIADTEILRKKAMRHKSLNPFVKDSHFVSSTFKRHAAYSSAIKNCVGDAWLAMGDAAVSYDPLSSFGITSALSSAFYGSQAIMRYFDKQPEFLMTYEQMLQQHYLTYLNKRTQEYAKVDNSESDFWKRRK